MKFYEGSIGDKMARLKGGKLSLSDVLRLDKHNYTARSLVFALQKLLMLYFSFHSSYLSRTLL